jgi:hypothetical protein
MTIFRALILLSVFSISLLQAKLTLPREIFTMDQMEEVKTKAASSKKPISFVFADIDDPVGIGPEMAIDAMNILKVDTMVVYIDATKKSKSLPKVLKEALQSKEAGKFYPKVVIFDSELSKAIAYIPYDDKPADYKKSIQAAQRIIRG